MNKVLVINASVRKENSYSRMMTSFFQEYWQKEFPNDLFHNREVGLKQIPAIDKEWIQSAFVKPENRNSENQDGVTLSDELVSELKEHNIIIIGTPMYNWSIPSGLKAYIDQIMRINETWRFRSGKPDGDYVGLLNDKELIILSSRGDAGYESGESNEHMNFQTTYLEFVFGMMGVKRTTTISLNHEEFGGELFERSKQNTLHRIKQLIDNR